VASSSGEPDAGTLTESSAGNAQALVKRRYFHDEDVAAGVLCREEPAVRREVKRGGVREWRSVRDPDTLLDAP
jgi:hypothetical protein